ncbi:MAG: dUTP pyrophosphatase [Bacteroidales bacterium]|jgi:dUTP pyrophosphatase|nr:dUTP pyrophosphatase [Bacteroidales bacterium]MDN5328377.1 dUTP pyrophosphatase [Bacteroidales bacterium]
MLQLKIINKSGNELPKYQTEYSAGMDLRANLRDKMILSPGQRALVPTGLFIEIPIGYEGQVRPRSGLAAKYGITVLNAPGTIDADYRGEVQVILINLGNEPFEVNNGDRIAQLIIAPVIQIQWKEEESLEETLRGKGGFGHTGK